MASLAFLALTKSALGAGITGAQAFVGGLFTGLIDQVAVLPRLFPGPDNTGPKFDDTHLQSATEGQPINRCYGGSSRMGGQVLWMSDLQKVDTLAVTSGKGGGFQVTTDQYKIDMAVAFCGNEVEGIDRIWFDGKPAWTDNPDVNVTSDVISSAIQATFFELTQSETVGLETQSLASLYSGGVATISGFSRLGTFTHTNPAGANALFFAGSFGTGSPSISLDANGSFGLTGTVAARDSFTIDHGGSIGVTRYWFFAQYTASAGSITGISLRYIDANGLPATGLKATVADNTQVTIEGGSNGDYQVLSSGFDPSTNYPQVRLKSPLGQTHAAGDDVTAAQTVPAFDPAKLESITIYTGTDYQDPDPTMEAALGPGNAPAYRGRTYVLLKGLVLTDFGNRPPNVSARCTQSASLIYDDAVESMLNEAGLPSAYHDTSALTDPAPGYYAQGPLATSQKLQPYGVAGEFVAREEEGVLTFYNREDVPEVDVDAADLGAAAEGGDHLYPASVSDMDDLDVPVAVEVSFLDPSKDYQAGSITERAMGVASGVTAHSRLPLALTTAKARDLALHALHNARTNRQRMTKNLPPSYLGRIIENTRLTLTAFDEDWKLLTQRVDIGDDWVIQLESLRQDPGIAAFAESGEAPLGVSVTGKSKVPPALRLEIMDAAALNDAHTDRLGFYYAASAYQSDKWGSAVLYASSDGGTTFKYVSAVQQKATMGEATTVLADGPIGYLDRVNTVTVELDAGELESVTLGECLKGANRMWISSGARGEIIGFTTATLVGTRTYTLSGLLRGLRDTRDYTGSHAAGDTVVLLGQGVQFYETNAASVNVQRIFKLVPNGGAVVDAPQTTERLQGYTMRPFAPAHVEGTRDGSNNLTVTAVKRSRRLVSIISEIGAPGADPIASMTYELDVMDGATVKRTITASTLSFSYSAANQTTDGFTPGDPITVRVYAVSETVGRGNYTEETV